MIPCLKDEVLHCVKVIDGVMMEMIGAIMPVIPKIDINPMQRFVFDPSWPFTLNYLKNINTLIQLWSLTRSSSQQLYNSKIRYSQIMCIGKCQWKMVELIK